MKVVFLGTPDFACEALKAIFNSTHEILAVVTQPDKPVGRKGIITPSDVKVLANNLGLKTLTYNKISVEGVEDLKSLNPDIMVTCAYGQILSREVLDIAKHGIINVHASLLPKYRGASPIQWAIINGDEKTGVTIMQTEEGVDTGDIIAYKEVLIGKTQTAGELFEVLSKVGAELIVKTLDDIEKGIATFIKQDGSKASKVGMIKKQDGLLDFSKPSSSIVNLIRGLNPWPIAFTYYNGKMLKIYSAEISSGKGNIGEVLFADDKNGIVIATGDTAIKINELQLEGSKKMTAKDFLLGRKIPVGYKFGE
ncbi:MAG: methionyl-tRNA formyltransferase [Clostridia bacterium]|nr:methionyl-tRNA formyltransferase [Clostridia bacterium]